MQLVKQNREELASQKEIAPALFSFEDEPEQKGGVRGREKNHVPATIVPEDHGRQTTEKARAQHNV
jgi:hypothetical protein